jgi:hypothetical protein
MNRKENLIANVLYGIAADLELFGHEPHMRLTIADRARRFATKELHGTDPFAETRTTPSEG